MTTAKMKTKTEAVPSKKLGQKNSATRIALEDAAEQLIREQGFGPITSRIVAARAGLKPQLIHYYFNTMDDLFVAVFRRGAQADLARLAAALQTEHPLRAMWKLSSDPKSTRFITEFMALANHNAAVRAEITLYAEKRREVQAAAVSQLMGKRGLEAGVRPMVVAVVMENVMRGLVLEAALDIELGHAEMDAFIESWLEQLDPIGKAAAEPAAPARAARTPAKAPPRPAKASAPRAARPRG